MQFTHKLFQHKNNVEYQENRGARKIKKQLKKLTSPLDFL